MAKKSRKPMIQVFIVSWFPIGATEASTLMSLTRDRANDRATEIRESFAAYPGHDPMICINREKRPVS